MHHDAPERALGGIGVQAMSSHEIGNARTAAS
jgi:hypothetical protein